MWWLCGYVAFFVWFCGSEAGGCLDLWWSAGRLTFGCVVVFGFVVPNRHFFHDSARYVVAINGRSVVPRKIAKFGYVVPTKSVQMTWICSTLLLRCIWICGVVSICGGQPGVLDMDI